MACFLPLVARHCVKKGSASWGWGDQGRASARPLQHNRCLSPSMSQSASASTGLTCISTYESLSPLTLNSTTKAAHIAPKLNRPPLLPRYRVLSFVITLSEFSWWLVRLKDGRVKTFLATSPLELIPKLRGV